MPPSGRATARHALFALAAVACVTCLAATARRRPSDLPPPLEDLVRPAAEALLADQDADGAWPYEGVYRVRGEIPLGYRVGGTAAAATALLYAFPDDPRAGAALERAADFILRHRSHPELAPSARDAYDVRVWGQAAALEFLCRLRAAGRRRGAELDEPIAALATALLAQELPDGGWNYAGRRAPASFVTAFVVQALLWARSQGAAVPAEPLRQARASIETARGPDGGFAYMGSAAAAPGSDLLPGSVARAALCESTLLLLAAGSPERTAAAVDAFQRHWDLLEERRARPGTHAGPHGIAPYYFYFGHRAAAQAIELLPPPERFRRRSLLRTALLRTRDPDGTWNDRVFPRSRSYGTAMALLALLADRVPSPSTVTAR